MSFLGPALPELRHQTGSTVGQMGIVFSAQSVGGLLGSIVAGRVFRRFGGRHLIALALGAFAVAIIVIPGSSELAVIVAAGSVIGFGAGSVDVGGNTVVSGLVAPERLVSSINALHMSFAVGAVIAPLMVGISLALADSLWPAFAVFAGGTGAVACVLWFGDRAGSARQAADDHAQRGATPDAWRLALVALFFLLYVGLEIGFAGWIATYSDELGLGSGWATGLTVAFWAGWCGAVTGFPPDASSRGASEWRRCLPSASPRPGRARFHCSCCRCSSVRLSHRSSRRCSRTFITSSRSRGW